MWDTALDARFAAASPTALPGGPGFTFANPTPVVGMPVPSAGPVAPVIPGSTTAPTPAAATAAAPGGGGAAAPAPVIPGGGGRVRNAISRGREALGRVRERVSESGPARNFVSDFAAGVAQPTEGGPLAAFLGGFARAVGSDRARSAAEAEAAAAAEETNYQRGRDTVEDQQWAAEQEREQRNDEYANLRTQAEIRRIEREAARELSPGEVINARTAANSWLNTQLDSYKTSIGGGADDETRQRLTRQADEMYADLLEDALNGRTGGTASGTTPGAGSTAAGAAPTPVHLQGIGTQAAPYTGNFTQAMIDGFPSGTWIRVPDPASPTGFRDYRKP